MSAAFPGTVSVGRVIDGRFPLLRQLGGSESSAAFLTELDGDPARKAAIKIFPFDSVDVRATTTQWDQARTLSHPHLMPLLHAGRCEFDGEDLLYVVTDYADETLSQILPERPLSPQEAGEMLGPVLDALSYLHERCLPHGHLRPTNIMVVADHLKLSPDFGWRSRARSIYDPPEAGAGHVAPEADIWSLGVLLVEALTQRPPLWDISQGGEPDVPAAIPQPFFTIARECLRVDPARRCTLAGIKAQLHPAPVAEPAGRAPKPAPRSRAMILAGAILFLIVVIAALKIGYHHTAPSPSPAPEPSAASQPSSPVPAPVPSPPPAPAAETSQGAVVAGSVAHQVLPDIPGNIAATIQGHVNVAIRVEVDPEGNVSRAAIESPGSSRYFANQALHAARNWKFTPAQVDGRTAAAVWLLHFQFGQTQIEVTSSEESPRPAVQK